MSCVLWDWTAAELGQTETSIYAPFHIFVHVVSFLPPYRVPLCMFGFLETHFVGWVGLSLNRDSTNSASQMVRLSVCTTMPYLLIFLVILQCCFLLRSSGILFWSHNSWVFLSWVSQNIYGPFLFIVLEVTVELSFCYISMQRKC